MALGADWCNAARAFMFSIGCIQALRCQTNTCPAGVATQNNRRQKGLVVTNKAQRVFNYHRNTIDDLAEVVAACGLEHPKELTPKLLCHRTSSSHYKSYEELFEWCTPNIFYEKDSPCGYSHMWQRANVESFC